MAKQTDGVNDAPIATGSLSAQDLVTLLTSAIAQSNAGQQENLIAALAELKKPYENPGQKQLEEQERAKNRKFRTQQDERIKISQDNCPHLQGCNELSDRSGDQLSIVKHRFDDGKVIGICTNCHRIFKPGDQDYRQWMMKKSGNIMSQAGQRFSLAN